METYISMVKSMVVNLVEKKVTSYFSLYSTSMNRMLCNKLFEVNTNQENYCNFRVIRPRVCKFFCSIIDIVSTIMYNIIKRTINIQQQKSGAKNGAWWNPNIKRTPLQRLPNQNHTKLSINEKWRNEEKG